MIGRTAVLDRLRSVIEQADGRATGLPGVVLIAGEAGIGKTRLVREALADLPDDVTVFSATAEPGSLARPHDLVRQLAPAGSITPSVDAIARLEQASGVRTLLVIDDLHWVDADGAAFVDDVARRAWPNLVIVGTYRPSDLRRGAPGGDLVSRLERRNEVEQFRLDRLTRHEVGAMMVAISGAAVSSSAVEAVTRRSGGVPLVVEELMRCVGPDACGNDIGEVQLPWSLDDAVRQQLAGFAPAERTTIDALAVLAEPAGFDVLAAVSGLGEADLLASLRALMAHGVVVASRDDRLWFGHALMADTVARELLGRERRRLHERCFAILSEVAPSDHAALARHARGAGRFDEIVGIARRGARDYLDRGASFQALRLACDGLSEDDTQAELFAVATEAAWRLDFLDEALCHASDWFALHPVGAERIDVMRLLGRLHVELEHDEATAWIERLEAEAAQHEAAGDLALLARAEAAVAQLVMLRHDGRAVEWAERAIEHARAAGDDAVLVQAQVERASSLLERATRAEALLALREAADGARMVGDGVSHSRAVNNMMELVSPSTADAAELRRELRRVAAAIGFDKLGAASVVFWDARAADAEGDLATYRRLLEVYASWRATATGSAAMAAEWARIAVEEGCVADARRLLDGVGPMGDVHQAFLQLLHLNLAEIERDPVAARAAFDVVSQCAALPDQWSATSLVVETVRSALAGGVDPAVVRTIGDRPLLRGHGSRAELLAAVEGLLLAAEGEHAAAVAPLRAAVMDAHTTMLRCVEGSLHLALAESLAAAGDRIGARAAAERAVHTLDRWPGWRRDRAEAFAARLEGPAPRSTGLLTARESEVAALVAEGLTNGQLAARLYISPKTASVHVSNILAKLGLSTRAEVAAWETRRHLPSGSAAG
jgi:DNA-binding CsgD family transcriptional regulator